MFSGGALSSTEVGLVFQFSLHIHGRPLRSLWHQVYKRKGHINDILAWIIYTRIVNTCEYISTRAWMFHIFRRVAGGEERGKKKSFCRRRSFGKRLWPPAWRPSSHEPERLLTAFMQHFTVTTKDVKTLKPRQAGSWGPAICLWSRERRRRRRQRCGRVARRNNRCDENPLCHVAAARHQTSRQVATAKILFNKS